MHQTEVLQPGDTLLLCTDGLTGVVSNSDLEEELRKGGHARRRSASASSRSPNRRGGPDNITVLLARVRQAD